MHGIASACLPRLLETRAVDVAMIIYSEGRPPNAWNHAKRKLKKTLKIGLLGALNGVRMRAWFSEDVERRSSTERLDSLASRYGIRLEKTPVTNCQQTADLFREAQADLGLCLGNAYIAPYIYSIPRYGMVNIHSEILPAFRGAQSVVWQIYEGSSNTGYTIHQVNERIDGGNILYQETIPIEFKPTLSATVSHNCARLRDAASTGLAYMLSNYSKFVAQSKPQHEGRSFTTPTFWQFLRIVQQHKNLYRKSSTNIDLPSTSKPF